MEERFAAEHKRFLEEHNPSVLRGQSDPDQLSLFGGPDRRGRCWTT